MWMISTPPSTTLRYAEMFLQLHFHSGCSGSLLVTGVPFGIWDLWLYYRILYLGKYENLIITTSFSLNQELPSIKEVNMENWMTKKTSIYVQSIEEREALLFPFEDIHWLFNSLPQTYHCLSPLPHSSSYPCFSFSLTHSFLLSHTHTHSNTNIFTCSVSPYRFSG